MSSRRKRAHAYHHHDLRNALIEEALVILREDGDANFTLRDLARRVGVSHAAPYAHFTDRRALLAAVATRGFELLCGEMSAAAADAENPTDAVIEMGTAYVMFGWQHPAHYRLMFQAPELADHSDLPDLSAAASRAYAALKATIGSRRSRETPVTVEEEDADAFVAWSHVHGMTSLLIDRFELIDAATEADVVALARGSVERMMLAVCRPDPTAMPARFAVAAGA